MAKGKLDMNIEDNFLEDKDFKHLQDQMTCNYFPWYYVDKVATKDDNDFFYMGHLIFDQYKIIGPWGFDLVQPMIDKLKPKSIVRIKANLYPKTQKLVEHGYHIDYDFDCKTALFYLNTNDGYTKFKKEGKKVASVENRMVYFNARDLHKSTNCTDEHVRITISFNYF